MIAYSFELRSLFMWNKDKFHFASDRLCKVKSCKRENSNKIMIIDGQRQAY